MTPLELLSIYAILFTGATHLIAGFVLGVYLIALAMEYVIRSCRLYADFVRFLSARYRARAQRRTEILAASLQSDLEGEVEEGMGGGGVGGGRVIRSNSAILLRFILKIRRRGGCWIWEGARSRGKGNKKWYGSFNAGGVVVRAHKFAFIAIRGGELPQGYHLDHECENSLCVNPWHLKPVTPTQNSLLRWSRRRSASQDISCQDKAAQASV